MERPDALIYAKKFLNVDLRGRKLIGISISELISKYYKNGREAGINQIAAFIDRVNDMGYGVVLIPHVAERDANNDDQIACIDVLRRVKSSEENVLMSGWFSSVEVKSIIGLCDLLIGARTHATIASMSQGIPTVAIAYSRKAYGIMEDFYGPDLSKKLIIPAERVHADSMMDAMIAGLESGIDIKSADRMINLALKNFELLEKFIPEEKFKI
jgi:colanic acid/amylovoran biosynthesis protein